MKRKHALSCSVGVLMYLPSLAWGAETTIDDASGPTVVQAAPQALVSSEIADPSVPDIIVTAQRRAEPLQKVPIAITAIQPEQLREQNITDLATLKSKLATFDFKTTGVAAGIYLRGVGQNGAFANNENSVAMYVDDVYMGIAQMTKAPFNNITQLVVLKGPQGTLFGRNATGGVVQISTANPSHDTKFDGSFGYGNFETVKGAAYVTGGISDTIAANFSVIYQDQGKGWGRNLFLNQDILFKKTFGTRAKLLFQPGDKTDILVSFDYSHERNTGLDTRPAPGNPRLATYPSNAGFFDTYANFPDFDTIRHGGVSLKAKRELSFANFVSITAYRRMNAFQSADQDSTPASIVSVHSTFKGTQFTQEIQLLSNEESKLKWTVGAFYMYATPFYAQDLFEAARHTETKQLTSSVAVYGQVTYPVFNGTNITGGLRLTHEDQKLVDAFTNTAGLVKTYPDGKQSFDKPTWRLSVDQQLSNNILAYASYNRGIKTGGFNMGAPTAAPYAPEKLDAYEVGLKTQLFNRRVRFNVAAFHYDYSNLQISQAAAGTTFISNAAAARIDGVDGDIDVSVARQFSIYGGFGFLNGKYTSFTNSVAFTAAGAAVSGNGIDVTGNQLAYAPKFSGNAGARYQAETSLGKITVSANINHFGGSFTSPDDTARISSYDLVNSTIQWLSTSGKFDVQLWGANLLNKHYLSYAIQNGVGLMFAPAEPRTYGITIGVHF
jgi:iron complex outermembrane receptor protein